ncbi:hypothetical protein Mesil_2285 [Allomeiothermus silvanus DSM 9946]|uniref:Lipoprotein n=1 Tax=Allomeiothermus silvanus (strain ATCC 700542 / DSM 9946 / NBRC 106475 / NCIMB 13440 / VI-R2) TaxID=526227 RepID=D7BIH5_ALLS1|nr:hypothetical protein [Allomeiothermus silvanus]ADH64150.1 hypothetical protein Mesil_2285 [Allomeiothermus silvanus DSM 9946]
MAKKSLLLSALGLVLLLTGCALQLYPVRELVLSERYRLVALDAILLERRMEGEVEVTSFRYLSSPYTPRSLEALGNQLQAQLESRGYQMRCKTMNALPILGGPQYTLRMSRGNEGVGLFLRPLGEPDAYRLEVGPADPNPPLTCPAR